jgi:hypothetical protein
LAVASCDVVLTTIPKFLPEKGEKMPELSSRRNIILIADEAHRRRQVLGADLLPDFESPTLARIWGEEAPDLGELQAGD